MAPNVGSRRSLWAALVGLSLLTLISTGFLLASNMGFKLVYTLKTLGPESMTGANSVCPTPFL